MKIACFCFVFYFCFVLFLFFLQNLYYFIAMVNTRTGVLNFAFTFLGKSLRAKEGSKTDAQGPNEYNFSVCFSVFWNWSRVNHEGLVGQIWSVHKPFENPCIRTIYTARLLWPAMWYPITQLLHWYLHWSNRAAIVRQLCCYHGVPTQLLFWSTCMGTPR